MRKRIRNYLMVLSCLLVILPRVVQAADENKNDKEFIFDRYWSPISSSSMIISSRALLNEAEDFVFRTKHAQYSIWGRIATTLVNYTCSNFLMVANHEIAGHGFRARSLGIPVSHYSFGFLG
jgi:hypothetical protein